MVVEVGIVVFRWMKLCVASRRAFPSPSTTLIGKAQEVRAMRVTLYTIMTNRLLSASVSTII